MFKITNNPQKGTKDWFPEEFLIRKYIFDVWRDVCKRYGYQEYLTPIFESADIYRAKSGEDIGGKELMVFTDKAGRELAIRPEMTPSVTRMVSRIYQKEPKPIRYFSIANFVRNEKPQRGRNREFWQLNFDVFGSNSFEADVEILQMAIEIILAFNPPKEAFEVMVNSRTVVNDLFQNVLGITNEQFVEVIRVLDKFLKLDKEEFESRLKEAGITDKQMKGIYSYVQASSLDDIAKAFPGISSRESFANITGILEKLTQMGYGEFVIFSPLVFRGFDYYDGMVFEVYDKNPENRRSMFGGGRYNGLAGIFGVDAFPAVGCAPGDETLYLFLQSWSLTEKILEKESTRAQIYFPTIDKDLSLETALCVKRLRSSGLQIETSLSVTGISKALDYAGKTKFRWVVLYGEQEAKEGKLLLRDMETGKQRLVSESELWGVIAV